MTSFPVEIAPRPEPRLAAAALLLHLVAAALPWATRCMPWLAACLSVLALASFAATLARLPGRRCRVQALVFRHGAWQARLARDACDRPVQVARGTRVYAGLIALDLATHRGRLGWLLTRETMDRNQFRRLKARLRLSC